MSGCWSKAIAHIFRGALVALSRRPWQREHRTFYRLFNAILENEGVSSDSVVHLPGSLGVVPMFDRLAASETLAAASLAHLQTRGIEAEATTDLAGHLSHGAHRPRYSTAKRYDCYSHT